MRLIVSRGKSTYPDLSKMRYIFLLGSRITLILFLVGKIRTTLHSKTVRVFHEI